MTEIDLDRKLSEPSLRSMLDTWRCLLYHPEIGLGKLLYEQTFNMCNWKVEEGEVREFLLEMLKRTPRWVRKDYFEVSVDDDGPYKDKKVRSISLAGERVPFNSMDWDEMVVAVCVKIAQENPERFPEVIDDIRGKRNRYYFAKDPTPLERRQVIGNTGIYVEKNLSANNAVSLCEELAKKFGYGHTLRVETW